MDDPKLILLDLVGGPMDGLCLEATDCPLGDFYIIDDKDRGFACLIDAESATVGAMFCVNADEMNLPKNRFPHYRKTTIDGVEHIEELEIEKNRVHKYRITGILDYGNESLIRAEYCNSEEKSCYLTSKVSKPKNESFAMSHLYFL